MRFVSRVHDRALESGLQTNLFLEEVGSLTDLERDVTGNRTGRLAPHLACTGKYLTCNEVWCDL